ncbi:MAG TPA: hypothetical protein DEV97_11220 [Lachnospiraceae bacterium]|nr:hypothetical protein [Lachnospiraceae bacterium]
MAGVMKQKTDEEERLTKEEEFRIDQRIRIGVILGAALILAYLAYCAVKKIQIGVVYYVIVGAFITLYWLFSDVIALKLKHGFAGRTAAQKSAYLKMAAVDLVGVIGLGMFLVSGVGDSGKDGNSGSSSLIGAVIYLICFMTAKRLRLQYEKESSTDDKAKTTEDKKDGINSLPTAADREKRHMTTAERLAALNRQVQDEHDSEEQSTPAGEDDD